MHRTEASRTKMLFALGGDVAQIPTVELEMSFLRVCIFTYTGSLSENDFQGFDLHDDSAILLARRVVIASKSDPILESKKY